MYFADVTDALTNSGFPPEAIFVISGFIAIVVYLARQLDRKQKKIDDLQDTRVTEAKEINDKLSTPMKEQTDLSKKIYDVLLNINNKRGR